MDKPIKAIDLVNQASRSQKRRDSLFWSLLRNDLSLSLISLIVLVAMALHSIVSIALIVLCSLGLLPTWTLTFIPLYPVCVALIKPITHLK